MKKIVLTAAAAVFAFAAQAQGLPNAEDNSVLGAQAQLTEVIVLTPSSQNSQAQPGNMNQVNTLALYENGIDLVENPNVAPLSGPGVFEFQVGASCGYDVTMDYPQYFLWAATPGAFGVDNQTYPMDASALELQVIAVPGAEYNNFSSMTQLNAAGASDVQLFGHATGHPMANWGINLHLTPGFGHQGGFYRLPIDITATTR